MNFDVRQIVHITYYVAIDTYNEKDALQSPSNLKINGTARGIKKFNIIVWYELVTGPNVFDDTL